MANFVEPCLYIRTLGLAKDGCRSEYRLLPETPRYLSCSEIKLLTGNFREYVVGSPIEGSANTCYNRWPYNHVHLLLVLVYCESRRQSQSLWVGRPRRPHQVLYVYCHLLRSILEMRFMDHTRHSTWIEGSFGGGALAQKRLKVRIVYQSWIYVQQ